MEVDVGRGEGAAEVVLRGWRVRCEKDGRRLGGREVGREVGREEDREGGIDGFVGGTPM